MQCRKCLEDKPKECFSKMAKASSGYQSECKTCASVRLKLWYDQLTDDQRAVRRQRTKAWRDADPENSYWIQMRSIYKVSQERFEQMLSDQGGVCAICKTNDPQGYGRWCIDHDHACCPGVKSCGQCIRGLLCNGCNHGLGNFRDSPKSLRAAANYLEQRD